MKKETVKKHKIKPRLTDEQAAKLRGTLLEEKDFNTLITYDADVYCSVTNNCIAKFRKKIIPSVIAQNAYDSLKSVSVNTRNRTISAGNSDEHGNFSRKMIKKDGTVSNTNLAFEQNEVRSGIIGYFDRTPRTPYCRQTSFNEKQFSKYKKAYPIIKFVNESYAKLMPKHYKLQKDLADKTSKDFVIKNTAFTTVTVNKNWQTALHTDKGDFEDGFGNLVVLRKGRYSGGYFVLPKWGVAFDVQNCDLLLVDVHQWHGNTPITMIDDDACRS